MYPVYVDYVVNKLAHVSCMQHWAVLDEAREAGIPFSIVDPFYDSPINAKNLPAEYRSDNVQF